MRGRAVVVLTMVLLPAAFLGLGGDALAADPVQIIEVDTAPRNLAPGGSATFEWTVRNLDTIPYNVTVTVAPVAGWQAVVDNPRIIDLAPNRAASVRLNVLAPTEVATETSAVFLVRFEVDDGGAVVFLSGHNATVTIPSELADKRVLSLFDNPLPPPLDNEYGVFVLNVLSWLVIAAFVFLLLGPVGTALTTRTKTQVDDIILRIVKRPLTILLFLYGTLNSFRALDAHLPSWLIDTGLLVYAFGSSLIFFYLGYRIFRDVFLHVARGVAKRTSSNFDDVFLPIVEKIGLVAIALAAFGLLLGFLNVDLTLFVAGGVVTSMVIAFAAQDSLSNFFAGIFLLTDHPFKEGDTVILADGDWVEVRSIGMRTTRMFRQSDASLVTIPNNKLVNDKIANFSNPRDQGRVMMKFSAGYGADAAKVKALIIDAINRCPNVVKQDPFVPIVRFDAMADSTLVFFVLVWIDHRDNRFAVQDFLNTEVYQAFGTAGIEIPFPQRTVHLMLGGAGKAPTAPAEGAAADVKRKLGEETPPPPTGGTVVARTGEADSAVKDAKGAPRETVGDVFDEIVTPATSVAKGSPLIDAVRSLLTVPVTRKVYVVDAAGTPVGTLTLEEIMRKVSGGMGTQEAGTGNLLESLKGIQGDPVEAFTRKPRPVSKGTKLVEVARMIVEERLNDFPVVDEGGRLVGELNSQRLLEVVLAMLGGAEEAPAAGPGLGGA